ncbi:MAG: hypothetical protein KJ749_04635 [Planctomycetes bacterium]|nr:hypothetical protein [Planctomycetota bacterium]
MTQPYRPIDLSRLKTYSIDRRHHKASAEVVAALPEPGASAAQLLASFPDYLGARALRRVVAAMVEAVRHNRPVVVAFGAHVIKVGCGPILVDLIRRGIVKAVAGNGACAIHDMEMATRGETSEEVADTIRDGSFGMVGETLGFFDEAAALAKREAIGLGAAVGQLLIDRKALHADRSVFAAAYEVGIPATVHVALGTDTVHMSPGADGAAIGAASMYDFRLICDVVADLGATGNSDVGGVWLNVGSAVLMPEVFLKAVSIARNLGADLDAMTTANFDMIRHYRPQQNVVTRPVAPGRGHEVVGHHEILLPLLRQAVIEGLASAGKP